MWYNGRLLTEYPPNALLDSTGEELSTDPTEAKTPGASCYVVGPFLFRIFVAGSGVCQYATRGYNPKRYVRVSKANDICEIEYERKNDYGNISNIDS